MDAILIGATRYQRSQTLLKMTNGFGLDDAYRTTLDRIREQKGYREKLGISALMWIPCSKRPLKAEELCNALAVETGTLDFNAENVPTTRTLMSCTLGLVTIDEQGSTVRLVHFTLQEYIAANNLFVTPHSMMAEICLTYLNFLSICDLSTSLDTIPLKMPFLHYASCFWGSHAKKHVTEGVKQLALRLLRRDAGHISADILLREESVDFLSWLDRRHGKHPDLRGFTGLHCIAYMGATEIAMAMVDMGVWDLNGRDSKGATQLIWALKSGNPTLAKLLLEQGDVNPTLSDNGGLTPLAHAAKAGHQDVVELLLQRENVNADMSDGDGRTPLSLACQSGNEGVVKILLESGDVDSDSSDEYGLTPLLYAAESGHEVVVRILLERRDVNSGSSDNDGQTPLSYAAQFGYEGIVEILLERVDINPDSPDKDGRTPLSYAAKSGHEGIVKILLERGDVSSDSSDKDGRTPLSCAAKSGHEGVVQILVQRGDVNLDSSDKDGRTPLSYAAGSGLEGVVKMLLEQGDVNPDSSDKAGRTPLSYAARYGHEGVVKILLERGDVNSDSSDKDGQTPQSYAARFGHGGVVKILLGRGDFNPEYSDNGGRIPLGHAERSENIGVVRPLSKPRPFSHQISQTNDLTLKIPSPAPRPLEEVEPRPVSRRENMIPDLRHEITEATPLLPPDQPSLNQLQASPPVPALAPIPTSHTTPDSTMSQHSRPPRNCITALHNIFYQVKRRLLPSSQLPRGYQSLPPRILSGFAAKFLYLHHTCFRNLLRYASSTPKIVSSCTL